MPKTLRMMAGGHPKRRKTKAPWRYFPVPKRPYELGDIWKLPDKQFKLYHYLLWKTWGFGKEKDSIPIKQMRDGLTCKTTGFKQAGLGWGYNTIRRTLDKLCTGGWIKMTRSGATRYTFSAQNPLLFDADEPAKIEQAPQPIIVGSGRHE